MKTSTKTQTTSTTKTTRTTKGSTAKFTPTTTRTTATSASPGTTKTVSEEARKTTSTTRAATTTATQKFASVPLVHDDKQSTQKDLQVASAPYDSAEREDSLKDAHSSPFRHQREYESFDRTKADMYVNILKLLSIYKLKKVEEIK
ncbi:hypothetical protein ANCCAN_04935 [Ancylostoma caninum]|uniref:Uncharacterized protein n=1 Tax=Ancylostoma caninum TaxID=29170 RepID=A0A368GX70_ANCCA|nr:hypothetical protein ANCCAN_04935 [Ancylostoma caninum]